MFFCLLSFDKVQHVLMPFDKPVAGQEGLWQGWGQAVGGDCILIPKITALSPSSADELHLPLHSVAAEKMPRT